MLEQLHAAGIELRRTIKNAQEFLVFVEFQLAPHEQEKDDVTAEVESE